MTDLSQTIAPKSNQLNADDLLASPRTITVTSVKASGNGEQPIAIYFQGDDGKPYLPCKSMRRLLVALWGADGKAYTGRSMTLYCDPKVKWGGIEVGGIRISHLSHIEQDTTLALTESKSKRTPHRVKVLRVSEATKQVQQQDAEAVTEEQITAAVARLESAGDLTALAELWALVKTAASAWPKEAKQKLAVAEKMARLGLEAGA